MGNTFYIDAPKTTFIKLFLKILMDTPNLKYLAASTLLATGLSTTAVLAEATHEISGAVEVEINTGKDHTAAKGSDIALATVELVYDAQINDHVNAHILMLHEDGSAVSPTIDEGVITITSGKDPASYKEQGHHRPGSPLRQTPDENDLFMYFSAGRMYVPFGNFESNMISDPLTLELGETQQAAVQLGFATGGFQASFYAFNGETDLNKIENDVIDDFGLSLTYSMETDSMSMDIGFDFINNMADVGGIEEVLATANIVEEHTAGMALHAIVNINKLTVIIERISSADDFNTTDLTFNGAEASPCASNIEIAYTMDISGRVVTVAIAAQKTTDIDPALIGLPESRTMLSVSTTIADDVGFAVEFSNASDYKTTDGGTGESGGMLTTQFVVEF